MTTKPEELTSMADDWKWKGGFDPVSWRGRYAEYMMQVGMGSYEAEIWAVSAWECADDDCDPEETASADIAYSADDAA